jgi:polysaccharide biosynthesis/export protein
MRMTAAIALAVASLALSGAVSAQASADAPVAGAKPTTSTYRISAGDQLQIYVWGDERLQRALTVLPDGTFAFPLAGTIQAAGHTPNEIEDALAKLLAPQYKGVPQQVTVSVSAPVGMQYSVIGKVRAPGNFSPARYVNVLNALTQAGGPTDFADINNIIIMRTTNGRSQVIRTHLANIFKGKPSENDMTPESIPLIQSGDTVIVP